ncbi:MAG TPA: flagellar hook capping FlgD N-terminal domain-containing protein [Bryobacteraceae bacterium]|nr:flagellar hook capping FlgD N-terminal domain-containing protein [Bryobacteraceae bacterium]
MQVLGTSALTNALQPLASANTGTNGASNTNGTSSSSSANSAGSLTSEATFLKLLIAQIQNQDPLNPTDSIQFVGQLVQYSELEQLMGINQGVQTLDGSTSSTNSTNGTSPSASIKGPSSSS